jgi:putative PIN family toxin of toxin-antitoxin system
VRLVLDTNAAVSGLLWQGNPGKLLDAAQAGSLTFYASAPLLAELHGVLGGEKFAKHLQVRGLSATQIFEGYAALTTVVVPAIIPPAIIDDPDDDAVLACAVAAKADLMVSGDPHLLKLEHYQRVPISSRPPVVNRVRTGRSRHNPDRFLPANLLARVRFRLQHGQRLARLEEELRRLDLADQSSSRAAPADAQRTEKRTSWAAGSPPTVNVSA